MPIFFNEQVIAVPDSFDEGVELQLLMIESYQANNKLFEETIQRDFKEEQMIHEGATTEEIKIFSEGTISNIIDRLLSILKSIRDKIRELWNRFIAKIKKNTSEVKQKENKLGIATEYYIDPPLFHFDSEYFLKFFPVTYKKIDMGGIIVSNTTYKLNRVLAKSVGSKELENKATDPNFNDDLAEYLQGSKVTEDLAIACKNAFKLLADVVKNKWQDAIDACTDKYRVKLLEILKDDYDNAQNEYTIQQYIQYLEFCIKIIEAFYNKCMKIMTYQINFYDAQLKELAAKVTATAPPAK